MLKFRPASPALLDELCRVDIAAWGEDMAATREMLQRRMEVNPTGNYVAIESVSGRIAGSVWTLWVDDRSFQTWMEATGDGLYDGSHSPFGEVLFGANISVDRAVPATQAVGPFLIENVIGLVPATGRQYARMGGRMSGYRPWSKLIAPADYIRLYRAGPKIYLHDIDHEQWRDGGQFIELLHGRDTARQFIDPQAWPACQAPLQVRPFDPDLASFTSVSILGRSLSIKRLLPGYFPDPDSCDNGVLLEWVNDESVR
jgi:hypothetical protein